MPKPTEELLRTKASVEADLMTWLTVHGNLSLALRHPGNRGPSRAYVARFVRDLGQWLVRNGALTQEQLECHYALESEEGGIERTKVDTQHKGTRMEKGTLPAEEAAEFRTNIEGWVCKTCRRFYGNEADSERIARYCCQKDHACGTQGCKNRAEKHYIVCDACRAQKELERYLKLPEVEWDGETPLAEWNGDTFFFSADDLDQHLGESDMQAENLQLVVCEEEEPPAFDLRDFLGDHLPEELEPDDPTKLEAVVQRWIEKHVPTVWTAGRTRPSPASLRRHLRTVAG